MCVHHPHSSLLSTLNIPILTKPFIVITVVNNEDFFLPGIYYFILCERLYACVCTKCIQFQQRPEEGFRVPVIQHCKLPYGCWKVNLGPLWDHQMLLYDGPSLQTSSEYLYCFFSRWNLCSQVRHCQVWSTFPTLRHSGVFLLPVWICGNPTQVYYSSLSESPFAKWILRLHTCQKERTQWL